jgi:hypothetical protein
VLSFVNVIEKERGSDSLACIFAIFAVCHRPFDIFTQVYQEYDFRQRFAKEEAPAQSTIVPASDEFPWY